ncbi:hypothetical protein EZS27_038027, partial [termite gut metagenome]
MKILLILRKLTTIFLIFYISINKSQIFSKLTSISCIFLSNNSFLFIPYLKSYLLILLNVRNSENQTYNSAIIGDGYGNHGRAKRVIYRYKNYTMQEQLTWRKKINSLHTFDA